MLDPREDGTNEEKGADYDGCAEQDEPSPVEANRGYKASCYVDRMTGDIVG